MKNLMLLPIFMGVFIISNSFSSHSQNYLDANNVKARINYDGDLFWDYISKSEFEVPKGSNKHTIFVSALWIGGYDAGGNLHEAAQTYRQNGTDYYAGPLDTLNLSTDTTNWQKTWKVNKSTIEYHHANWKTPGYKIPDEIKNWPGNDTGAYSKILAPFVDLNSNNIYEPQLGDYPYIFGDQTVYFIMNDAFSTHNETKCPKILGVEVHVTAFEFNSLVNGDSLNNIVFLRYEIKNCSNNDYHNLRVGIYTDFDIGYAYDDFIGCDSSRNMYYGFNGTSYDSVYGLNPPLQAVKFLNDTMKKFVYYYNNFSYNGNPTLPTSYYYYLDGVWQNGQPMRYGGDGFNNIWVNSPANYMFPSDPRLAKPAWSETSAGDIPGDIRGLGSIGPYNFKAKDELTIDLAYIYVRTAHSNYLDQFDDLYAKADQIQNLYNQGLLFNSTPLSIKNDKSPLVSMNIFPNPMENFTNITLNNPSNQSFNLKITDISGRTVYEEFNIKTNKIMIENDNLVSGFYIVTLENEQQIIQAKLIVK